MDMSLSPYAQKQLKFLQWFISLTKFDDNVARSNNSRERKILSQMDSSVALIYVTNCVWAWVGDFEFPISLHQLDWEEMKMWKTCCRVRDNPLKKNLHIDNFLIVNWIISNRLHAAAQHTWPKCEFVSHAMFHVHAKSPRLDALRRRWLDFTLWSKIKKRALALACYGFVCCERFRALIGYQES